MYTIQKRYSEYIVLGAILLLAALLRLGRPGIVEFKGDEAGVAQLALDLVEGRAIPLQGTGTSIGLPEPPMSVYVYAIPFLFTRDPLAATLFTGALNVGAVALCWWVGRRYGGPAAGLCAAFLFASSPWATFFSRKIWEPNLLPPFALACMATGLLAFLEGRRWALAAHIFLLAVTVQFHYSGFVIALLTILMLIIYRKRVNVRALAVGAGLAMIAAAPFALSLVREWRGTQAAFASFFSGPSRWDAESLHLWWIAVTGSEIHSLAGSPTYLDFLRSLPNLTPLHLAVGALAIGGIAFGLWRVVREPVSTKAAAGGIVALWAILPALLMLRHSSPLYLHYFIVLFPAPYLAAGFLLAQMIASRRRWLRWGAAVGTAAIGLAQAVVILALLNLLGRQATPGGFGVPLQVLLATRDRALALSTPVVIVGPGDDPRTGTWVAVFDVLLRGKPHRFVDGNQAAIFPATPSTLLVTPGVSSAAAVYADAGVIGSWEVIAARAGEEPFRLARWKGGRAFDLASIAGPRALSNGAELVGYRWQGDLRPGGIIAWWIAWRVWKTPADPAAAYHIFNHLLDAGDKVCSQADSPTVPTRDWQVDDWVVQFYRLQISADAGSGPYTMRVGMYRYPGMESQPALDVAGNPAADWVMIRLENAKVP